jgi:hypothetical protein
MHQTNTALNKILKLVDAVEDGKVPLKAVEKYYPAGKEVYVARFNGYAWIVQNPTNFITKEAANKEIETICAANPMYIDERKIK